MEKKINKIKMNFFRKEKNKEKGWKKNVVEKLENFWTRIFCGVKCNKCKKRWEKNGKSEINK